MVNGRGMSTSGCEIEGLPDEKLTNLLDRAAEFLQLSLIARLARISGSTLDPKHLGQAVWMIQVELVKAAATRQKRPARYQYTPNGMMVGDESLNSTSAPSW